MHIGSGRYVALAAAATTLALAVLMWPASEARGAGSPATIAFIRTDYRYRGHLFLMNSDGSGQRRIAVRAEGFPVWSPDGDTLAFADGGGRRATLNTIGSDGTGRRVVTREGRSDCIWPTWSPDGEKLAFTRNDLGCDDGLDIFLINADSSGRRRVTRGSTDAVWSPDGGTLLYRKFLPGLFLLNLDTGKQRRIPGARPVDSNGVPSRPPAAWSPDGQRIFYIGDDEALHVTNLDGSDDRNLTPTMDRVVSFTISPTWNEIAVAGRQGVGGREIYVLNTDGTELRRLTDNGAIQDDDPQWSPDGRQIAFVRTESDRGSEIFVMNSDGSEQTNISRHPADDEAPAWQPLTTPVHGVLPQTGANLVPALIIGIVVLSVGVASRAVGRPRPTAQCQPRGRHESASHPEPAPSRAPLRADRAPVEHPG